MFNETLVEIMGWNGATPKECIGFIFRKCRISIKNYSVDTNTGVLNGYVNSESQAKELCNWSGVKFAGKTLKIFSPILKRLSQNVGNNVSVSSNETIKILSDFLKYRYNTNTKFLNLSMVKTDPTLVEKRFFVDLSTASKFFLALLKTAKEINLEVLSIDLSSNEISEFSLVNFLASTFPVLRNLSLLNNNLASIKPFETLSCKLLHLRELIITGNPFLSCCNDQKSLEDMKIKFMRLFPMLVVLNNETLRDENLLTRNLSFTSIRPQAVFFENEEIKNIVTNFITNFYSLWDSKRSDLMVLYQNESQFSVQVDTSHPHSLENENTQFYTKRNSEFDSYLSISRNLIKVSSFKMRANRVAVGQDQIYKLFCNIPKTKHDFLKNQDFFTMESYRYPQINGIMIVLHGFFEETGPPEKCDFFDNPHSNLKLRSFTKSKLTKLGKKSFDRIFTVTTDSNGSIIVASDLLTIRPLSNSKYYHNRYLNDRSLLISNENISDNFVQENTFFPCEIPQSFTLPIDIKEKLTLDQQNILIKILFETKLNLDYGLLLCEQSSWDYNLCTSNFKNSIQSLPTEAFESL